MEAQKPKQIVYVWNYLEWGGAQVYFLGLAARLKGRAAVRFVFPRETSPLFFKFCDELGVVYELLDFHADNAPAAGLKRKIERHAAKIRTEWATIRHLRGMDLSDSIVHIELSPWQSLIALLMVTRLSVCFTTMHNALPEVPAWRRVLWKTKFATLARVRRFWMFTSNRNAKDCLQSLVGRSFLDRISVTYTNVNPDEVEAALPGGSDRASSLAKFGIPSDGFLVFGLGQFIDRKGRWDFLEAARRVAASDDTTSFVWITNSVVSAEDLDRVRAYGLGDRFVLLRSQDVAPDHLGLMRFLSIADLYVLPSYVEGLPISLLEAMSLGVPSISTNVYAIPEAVRDGETGILIEPGDPGALADAINELRDNDALRKSLGAAGRRFVLENFSEDKVAEVAWQAYMRAWAERR